jgi:hypothetical protein
MTLIQHVATSARAIAHTLSRATVPHGGPLSLVNKPTESRTAPAAWCSIAGLTICRFPPRDALRDAADGQVVRLRDGKVHCEPSGMRTPATARACVSSPRTAPRTVPSLIEDSRPVVSRKQSSCHHDRDPCSTGNPVARHSGKPSCSRRARQPRSRSFSTAPKDIKQYGPRQ